MNDVVLNKIQSIQRCIRRAREEHRASGGAFASDYTRQDAAMLNTLRACETAIDLANHVVRLRRLGVPNTSADSFRLLHVEGLIGAEEAGRLTRMVGFRNIVIHQYGDIDMAVVESVILSELDGLLAFADRIRLYLHDVD